MRFTTSKTIIGFAGISFACAILGGIAQVSQNISSSRLENSRSKAMTVVAQHVLSDTCRDVDVQRFQKGDRIEESGGLSPTACYTAKSGERAHVAYEGGKLTVKEVFSTREVNSKISQIREKEKSND